MLTTPTTTTRLRQELHATAAALTRLHERYQRALGQLRYGKRLMMDKIKGATNTLKLEPHVRRPRLGRVCGILIDPYSRVAELCYFSKVADLPKLLSRKGHVVTTLARVPIPTTTLYGAPAGFSWSIYCDDEALLSKGVPVCVFPLEPDTSIRLISGCCALVCERISAAGDTINALMQANTMKANLMELSRKVRYLAEAEADAIAPQRRKITIVAYGNDGHTHITEIDNKARK